MFDREVSERGSDMEKKLQKAFRDIDEDYLRRGTRRYSKILRELARFIDRSPDAKAWRLLNNIRTFLFQRFDYEDRLMCLAGCQNFPAHHEQHELMIRQLNWSIKTARRENSIDRNLCDFLNDWFCFHTQNLDRPLCDCNLASDK